MARKTKGLPMLVDDTTGAFVGVIGDDGVETKLQSLLGYTPVNKAGDTMTGPLLQADGLGNAPSYSFSSSTGTGFSRLSGSQITASVDGNRRWRFLSGMFSLGSGISVSWSNAADPATGTDDLLITRDGPGILAQRNGTNAQSFKIANTWTDASNYEYGVFDWITNSNTLTIGTIAAGTGTARGLRLTSASGSIVTIGHLLNGSSGGYDIGAAANNWRKLYIDYTNTGTVGAVTINKAAGRVNIAASGTSVVVTNSLVTAASHVLAVVSTNDATATLKNVVPAAGSFTITLTAAATAQVSVDFFLINAD